MKWWTVFVICHIYWSTVSAWGSERVLLRDLSALTLHQGRMTTGRRSTPVLQLKCQGGSAGCHTFIPQTVQCRNIGHDGYDVQWDCKTDMDDSYRFGKIQVTCEGYDYPDDPYVLKGSCGLEYNIEYTEAGKSRKQNYGGGYSYYSPSGQYDESSSGGWFLFLIVVFVIVYLISKMSPSSGNDATPHQRHQHDPRFRSGHPPPSAGENPSPYGFKREYTHDNATHAPPPYTEATDTGFGHGRTSTSTGGGFWSGLGLGTLGGYLFGSRRNRGWGYGGHYNNWRGGGWGNSSWGSGNRGWGSSWGSGNSGWGSRQASYRGSSSSGTSRTTSGFGGTTRR